MKILFASWNCNDKNDYMYQNWHFPLRKISQEIISFDPREHYFKFGKENMNERFLDIIKKEKPDFVFFTLVYDEFFIETIKKIKHYSPKTQTINFFSDDEWRFGTYSKYISVFFDYCITSYFPAYEKAQSLNLKNFYFMPYSCNTSIFKKLNEKKVYDVSFIGQPTPERINLISYLIKKGIAVNIWGKGWSSLEDFNLFKDNYRGIAEDFAKTTNQSKIMLSLLMDDNNKKVQVKGRIAEVAGCGTFQLLTENSETKSMLIPKKEADYFKNPEDLLRKIKHYLLSEKEREKIANNSYLKIIQKYNWDTLFKEFFNRISKSSISPKSISPSVLFLNSNDEIGSIKDKLKNMQEDYLIIPNKKCRFENNIGQFYSSANKNSDIIISDVMFEKKYFGEISAIRIHHEDSLESLKKLPLCCFAFSKSFVKRNINFILFAIKENSLNKLNNVKFERIAFPLVHTTSISFKNFSDTHINIAQKYKIKLFNLWHSKKYFSLFLTSIILFTSLLKDGNLFILNSTGKLRIPF